MNIFTFTDRFTLGIKPYQTMAWWRRSNDEIEQIIAHRFRMEFAAIRIYPTVSNTRMNFLLLRLNRVYVYVGSFCFVANVRVLRVCFSSLSSLLRFCFVVHTGLIWFDSVHDRFIGYFTLVSPVTQIKYRCIIVRCDRWTIEIW